MTRTVELLISGIVVAGGLCGIIWPELYMSSMEAQYTPRRARIASIVILLMGIAGLVAILQYHGEPVDFFPA